MIEHEDDDRFNRLAEAARAVEYRDWKFSVQRVYKPVPCYVAWVTFETVDARTGEDVHYRIGNTLPPDVTPEGLQQVYAAAVFHAEDHEVREFFQIGDTVPFDPHAGPNAVT
jgi:hypothetical protein